MTTTYEELYKKALLRVNQSSGRALLAVKQGVNDAHKAVARVMDVDELFVLDTTNALTVASTKSYHLVTNWSLTRPKDLYSLRLMDTSNSRYLTYVNPRKLDQVIPYTEISGTGKPSWYTVRGLNVELFRIPDAAYSVYVYYSQWPAVLSADTDVTPYEDVDDVIITLAAEIADSILNNYYLATRDRARELLAGSVGEERERPDRTFVATPFSARPIPVGEYWKDPFVERNP